MPFTSVSTINAAGSTMGIWTEHSTKNNKAQFTSTPKSLSLPVMSNMTVLMKSPCIQSLHSKAKQNFVSRMCMKIFPKNTHCTVWPDTYQEIYSC